MKLIKKLAGIAVGQFIAACAFDRILVVNGLVPTGFGGLATVLNRAFEWNVQLVMVCLALPVFIWSFIFYEKKQIFYAAFCFSVFTFYLGFIGDIIPPFYTDPIIAAVIGGAILGFAIGIVLKQKVSNGPEAIVGIYLKQKFGITIGTYFLVLNSFVIFSSILYGDLTMIAYSFICTYVSSTVADFVIVGSMKYYNVSIMSDQYLDITDFIRKELGRGVTFVQGMDAENVKKKMLLQTVVSKYELITLKEYIREFHDDSFVYANQSTTILGRGMEID